jgi:hypothetical protein
MASPPDAHCRGGHFAGVELSIEPIVERFNYRWPENVDCQSIRDRIERGSKSLNAQPAQAAEDPDTRLAVVEHTLWGRFGNNGLKGDLERLRGDIGKLFGRDDALRAEVGNRLGELEQRLNDKLDGIYRLMLTLMVSILVGAGGIIATFLVTK